MSEVSKQRVRLANAVLNSETMKDAALGGRGAGADIKEESFSDRQAAALEIEEVGMCCGRKVISPIFLSSFS